MTHHDTDGGVLDCRPSLAGKVAFVTGGMGGIGRACVQALLAHGATVAFTYADRRESADDARRQVDANPQRLSAHALDLRDAGSITRSLREAHARWGGIDILINNAAVGSATVLTMPTMPLLRTRPCSRSMPMAR